MRLIYQYQEVLSNLDLFINRAPALFDHITRDGSHVPEIAMRIWAGVPGVVAMRISGHKTRSVFYRCGIVNEADIRNVRERVNELYQENMELPSQAGVGSIVAKMNEEE